MAVLIYGALILAALILQSTLLSSLPLLPVVPDLLLILVVVLSILNGPAFGAKFGFAAGLAADLLVGQLIGLNGVTKMIIGYAIGGIARPFYKENYIIPFSSVFLASWADQLLYLLGMTFFGMSVSWRTFFDQVAVPLALLNSVLTVLIYVRLYYLNQRIAYWDELVKRSG